MQFRPKLFLVQDSEHCQGCPKGFRTHDYLHKSSWITLHLTGYHLLEPLQVGAVHIRSDDAI